MCTEKLLVIADLGKANVSYKLKSFLIKKYHVYMNTVLLLKLDVSINNILRKSSE